MQISIYKHKTARSHEELHKNSEEIDLLAPALGAFQLTMSPRKYDKTGNCIKWL